MTPYKTEQPHATTTHRVFEAGYCYHLLNRANDRCTLFHSQDDYRAFVRVLKDACDTHPLRVLAYCVMPNHFHFVVWPQEKSDISNWMRWLLSTHANRYHKFYGSSGHLWQGRFKSFPIQEDEHLLTVIRYVERNPLRASLVNRAEDWWWSSIRWRDHINRPPFLTNGPVALPNQEQWLDFVNQPQTESELIALRKCVERGQPYGTDHWAQATATALGLESTLKKPGRQKRR